MAIDLDSLSPYKSLLICNAPKKWHRATAIAEIVATVTSMDRIVSPSAVVSNRARHGVATSFFYYRVQGPPFWLSNSDLIDRVHELAMILQRGDRVVFLASEKRLRDKIARLLNKTGGSELGKVTQVPRKVLNSAYVRGEMKTAWTNSTSRRTDTRADSKNLGGPNVRHCIDPSVDQSYSLSASVNKLPGKEFGQPIGAAPRKGNIWAGASADGDGLCKDIGKLLDILDKHEKKPVDNPVPGLAFELDDAAALKGVKEAFAAALIPAELLEQDLDPAVRSAADRWSRLEFTVTPSAGLGFAADIALASGVGAAVKLGSIQVNFDSTNLSSILPTVTSVKHFAATEELHDEAIDAINANPDWLRVWYGSGHALGEGSVSANTYYPWPFEEYSWVDFEDYDVTVEKPTPLQPNQFGTQKSLFCWVLNKWSRKIGQSPAKKGWLACNDGALEIADFIHLDVIDGVRELTLIHAKACGNAKANRPISVGDFELVSSQAQKNLSFLHGMKVADEFEDFLGKGVREAVFHDGVLSTRAQMLAEIRKLRGGDYRRRVVIVQPRVTKSALANARAQKTGRLRRTAQQLDLLLFGLRVRCGGFGAELVITGHDC